MTSKKIFNKNVKNNIACLLSIYFLGHIKKLLTEELEIQPITSYVIEIKNKLLENTSINQKTIDNEKNEIKNKLNKWINYLDNNSVDNLNEYNNVLKSILSDLAEIDVYLDSYIDDLEEYEEVVNNRQKRKHLVFFFFICFNNNTLFN